VIVKPAQVANSFVSSFQQRAAAKPEESIAALTRQRCLFAE
jgi:hypothetical protein